MLRRQCNRWNWAATTYVYCNDFNDFLCAYDTEQVWDGTKAGHDRLMKQLVEHHEGLRDRTGLQYVVHTPTAVRRERWADKLPEHVEIG